jgi:hypothetical protein
MAGRPPKQGIDFAGWSTDVFEDPKIDELMEGQGLAGFVVYFYLCQRAYALYGYYLPWTCRDANTVARRIGCGVGYQTVIDTVGLCLRIGLFESRMFEGHGILTSRGLQRGYAVVLGKRRVKTVIADYWLLNADESAGAVLIPKNEM